MDDAAERERIAASLRAVRIALTGGVVGFGVFAAYLVERDGAFGFSHPQALRLGSGALLLAALAAILVLQRRHAREPDPRRRQPLNILAWATGEVAAFGGVVVLLLLGDPTFYYLGLGAMLAAFALVPIRR